MWWYVGKYVGAIFSLKKIVRRSIGNTCIELALKFCSFFMDLFSPLFWLTTSYNLSSLISRDLIVCNLK